MPVMQREDRARLSATPHSARPDSRAATSGRLVRLTAVIASVAYAVDQVSKAWALATLTGQPAQELLGPFLRLFLIRNPGAAFSVGTGSTWILTVLAVVIIVVVIRSARRLGSRRWALAFGLLLGGALGNLTDRLLREPGFGQGHVVDFIDYNGWFIGNVADIAIVGAAGLIGWLAFTGEGIEGDGATGDRRDEADGSDKADKADGAEGAEGNGEGAGEGSGIPAADTDG